jgi:hypothetical protein
MRSKNHLLLKFRLFSALLLAVFCGGGYLTYWLFLRGHTAWGFIAGGVSLVGVTASVIMVYSSLFRAKAVPGGICFVPSSFVAQHIVDIDDEFCPVFYKVAGISVMVWVVLFAAATLVGLAGLVLYFTHDYTGISYFVLVPALLSFIAMGVWKRESKVTLGVLITLLGILMVFGLYNAAVTIWETLMEMKWMAAVHVVVFLTLAATCVAMIYVAFNWDKLSETSIGKILAPLKRRTCIRTTVCANN